jgi:hypothetical protein
MLFLFSMVTMSQALLWLTFSPISTFAREYFKLCDSSTNITAHPDSCTRVDGEGQWQIDLMLMWGGIVYLFCMPCFVVFTSKRGLRFLVVLMAVLLCVACSLRIIPPALLNGKDVYLVHFAQILVALTGPIAMATPPKFSAVWFPPSERTLSTALACSGGFLGIALGFPTSTHVVHSAEDVPTLLWLHFLISGVSLVAIVSIFADKPPLPPSATAPTYVDKESAVLAAEIAREIGGDLGRVRRDRSESTAVSRSTDMCEILRDFPFFLYSYGGGTAIGAFTGWTASLDSILVFFTTVECGWLGFGTMVAFIVGNFIVGQTLTQKIWLRRIQKQIILFFLFAAFLFLGGVMISMDFLGHKSLLPRTFDSVCISIILAGFFLGCANPFLYEMCVEMTYPVSETVSAGILTFWVQFGTLMVLLTKRFVYYDGMNTVMTSAVLLSILCLFFTTARYNRLEEEDREHERKKLSTNKGLYIGDGSHSSYGSFGR